MSIPESTLNVSRHKPAILLSIQVIVWFLLIISCTPEKSEGVNLVLPRKDPPASSLIWSPANSNQILVTAIDETKRHTQVYVLDTATLDMNLISDAKPGDIRGVSWSPDGKNVVIAKYPNTEYDERGLWIWDMDNQTSEYVAEVGDSVSWSPSGNFLGVFRRPATLYLVDVETKQERRIFSTEEKKYTFGLSWSQDSKRIVFSMGDFVRSDLYILEIETGEVTQISTYGNNDSPAWSPNGNLIAYEKHYYSETQNKDISSLHLTNVAGTCDVEIPHTESALTPTWSPDGRQLAMLQSRDIYLLDLEVVFGRDVYQSLCP